MEPKKNFAATNPNSTSTDATAFDLAPPVGRHARDRQAASPNASRRSRSSLRSEPSQRAPSPCATREIPGEDCALQRFIVWTAVKRNKSARMAPSDRLSCPLVRCGERFNDHESMLRHLTKCQHLNTGEYLCYECMKIERFNDGKCRCCSGHPTKRRRIINMARSFFSNIGNRPRRGQAHPNFEDDISMPPPSYDSLVLDLEEQSERRRRQQQQQQQQQQQPEEQQQPQSQPQLELNSREIHELDSRQMFPTAELDPINYDDQSFNASATSTQYDTSPEVIDPQQLNLFPTYNESLPEHHDKNDFMSPPTLILPQGSESRRPSLALDTHVDRYRNAPRTKYLSPSSSLRSTTSSNSHSVSPVTPWSASSGSTGVWTMASSVDTEMTTPLTPLSPYDLPPASRPEEILASAKGPTSCPDDTCNYMIGNLPELPGDDSLLIPRGLPDPNLFPFDPKDNYSWNQSVDTELSLASVNMMFTDSSSKPSSMPSEFLGSSERGPETKAIVETAWDTLLTHFLSSLTKLSGIEGNPLVDRLRTLSPKTVALVGLSSLSNVLEGGNITDPLNVICFVHLVYAFSLVIHEHGLSNRCGLLYQQLLLYRHMIRPEYGEAYTQIATALWSPSFADQSRGRKGKEPEYRGDLRINLETDPFIAVGQNFLDDIENSVIDSRFKSDLWSTHVADYHPEQVPNSPFEITVNYIVQNLISNYQYSETLLSKLGEITQKVRTGTITSIRKVELSILQAGKGTLESYELFDKFIPDVRRLCGPIYQEQGFPRIRYQILGVSLVEALIHDMPDPQQIPVAFPSGLPEPYGNEYLANLHQTFQSHSDIGDEFINMDADISPQNQIEEVVSAVSRFHPELNPSALRSLSSGPERSTSVPESFTTGTSTAGTPSETFIASPDLPRAIAIPSPPKPSTHGHLGASPRSSSSTSQKVEANDACEFCGYRPKGDPQWFKGSMAKHKKLQHSTEPPVIYKCPFPGCNSQYKNRQDNLRQHQIEKNHFVGDEAGRRPSKRKKTSES